jgi:hypothetical protein
MVLKAIIYLIGTSGFDDEAYRRLRKESMRTRHLSKSFPEGSPLCGQGRQRT